MKLNMVILFILTVLLLSDVIFAQPQLWNIYSISNDPFTNVTVVNYEADSLYIKSMSQLFILHQDSIKHLVKINESNLWLGFVFGAVAGGIIGATNSSDSGGLFSEIGKGFSIVLAALAGGVLGGVVGLVSGSDRTYNIEKLDPQRKRKLLKQLFKHI